MTSEEKFTTLWVDLKSYDPVGVKADGYSYWIDFFLLKRYPLSMSTFYLLAQLMSPKSVKYLRLPAVFFFFLITTLLPYSLTSPALAQSTSLDLAYVYDIADKDAVDGDLLILDRNQGLIRATEFYDSHLFGVLQTKPLVAYKRVDNTGQPIIRNGIAEVNATTINGPIKPGDYITSSKTPGKGAKAIQSGYVIGVAISSLEAKEGKITVAMRIEYADITTTRFNSRLFDNFNAALSQNIQDPNKFVQVMRYIAAALCVLVSIGAGFFTFSRSIPKSIEAIGRNPLAQKAILFSIVLNISLTLLVAGIGVFVAFMILRI